MDVIQRVVNTDLFHVFKHLCIEIQHSREYVTVAPLYSSVVYGRPCDDTQGAQSCTLQQDNFPCHNQMDGKSHN